MKLRPLLLFLLALVLPLVAAAQPLLKFHVEEFGQDQFDLSARIAPSAQKDGDGNLYAIVKVRSNNPDDRLMDYRFNFGLLDSKAEMHDGVLWLYVQKGAKTVTISREGYARVERYDLGGSLQPGCNYVMRLSSQARPVYRQMLQFVTEPPVPNAVILIKSQAEGAIEEHFGMTDEEGSFAKTMPYGRYTYRIMAADYLPVEGFVALNDRTKLVENVALTANFKDVTLDVGEAVDIYLNEEPISTGMARWVGPLKYGQYTVSCRKPGHRDTTEYIEITPDGPARYILKAPEPIFGTVAINSNPTGATIYVDDIEYGLTPTVVELVVGRHLVYLEKPGKTPFQTNITVTEGSFDEVNAVFTGGGVFNIASIPSGAQIFINGQSYGTTPIADTFDKDKYEIRLLKDGYKEYNRRITLDPAKPDVLLTMSELPARKSGGKAAGTTDGLASGYSDGLTPGSYSGLASDASAGKTKAEKPRGERKRKFYAQAGFQLGMMMGPAIAFGANFNRINLELFANMSFKEKLYGYSYEAYFPNHTWSYTLDLIPISFGGRIGYNIPVNKQITITPRVGYTTTLTPFNGVFYGEDIVCGSIATDLRLSYKLSSCVSLVAIPQFRLAVYKNDVFKQVTLGSSKVKGWGTGADITVGVSFNF